MISAGRSLIARVRSPLGILFAVLSLEAAGLVAYSQLGEAWGDEGFHLVAAQLLNLGELPYRDFFYQHTPLYPFLLAGWMRLVGQTWQSAHLFSALLTALSATLVAVYLFSRHRPGFRLGGGSIGAVCLGLNAVLMLYGTSAQPFALCVCLCVAAFLFAVRVPERPRGFDALWAGLCAGGAVNTSMLAFPILAVLGGWLATRKVGRPPRRVAAQFCIGVGMASLPLLYFFARAPHNTFFDIVRFQLSYRREPFGLVGADVWMFDLRILTSWLTSTQGLLLALLGALGAVFSRERDAYDDPRRSEITLCIWLVAALGLFAATAHPTFEQYFLLLFPFLVILASHGVFAISSRVLAGRSTGAIVAVLLAIFLFETASEMFHRRELMRSPSTSYWRRTEAGARVVRRVARENEAVYAWEDLYFAAGIRPPSGLENSYTPPLSLPAPLSERLHVVSRETLDERLESGWFDAVVTSERDERFSTLARLYAESERLDGDDVVLWSRIEP